MLLFQPRRRVDFALGLRMEDPLRRRASAHQASRSISVLSLLQIYSNFIFDSLNTLTGARRCRSSTSSLPLGISFFTFQQIAYLVDVMRGARVEATIVSYTLFVSFFPHLIAGPGASRRDDSAIQARSHRLPRCWRGAGPGDLRRRPVQEGGHRRQSRAVQSRRCSTAGHLSTPAAALTSRPGRGSRHWPIPCKSISISPAIPDMAIGPAAVVRHPAR